MIDNNFPLYVAIFFLTFILTVIIERLLIPKLRKRAAQPIYADGPKWHMSKSGTPTMGGLAFMTALIVSLSISSALLFYMGDIHGGTSLLLSIGYAALNALVGIIDDGFKLKRKENGGLTPLQKILLQSVFAILFLFSRAYLLGDDTILHFASFDIDIGLFYYPIAFLILIGVTNCANLTDGIDGLASGVAFAIGVSFFYIGCALSTEVSFAAAAIMAASIGFLVFNMHPAKIFMGDTGSLMLGALSCTMSFMLENPLLILAIGIVYALEGASVIIQVLVFKLTHKRVFKMAPLHHHLEKCGWSENKICIVAIVVTLIASIPAFVCYLP